MELAIGDRATAFSKMGILMVLGMGALWSGSALSSEPERIMNGQFDELRKQEKLSDWATNLGADFKGNERVFYGVGYSSGLRNKSLGHRGTLDSASNNLFQIVTKYFLVLNQKYIETIRGEDIKGFTDSLLFHGVARDDKEGWLEKKLNSRSFLPNWYFKCRLPGVPRRK